ncbi:hypothetical protein Thi970DRAFT_03889 [Thiorhodovibrio frisius]|uniref:Uncharacterized protein n=2 Tax=Thiorhodovibrio frisius TaxID=631362 RepID=H8Z4K8_9GAMM|nr:hypothetical protein Thi970DRAFT_03889 [Thiorhodovibrio frisius]WPL21002.1 hypothetical protein Thiofri_01109 [Thiorhodovibrio frisius]
MIVDLAADYIDLGSTLEEKQNYLNVLCVAWNIAILPESLRKEALDEFSANYKMQNPNDTDENVVNIQKDIQLLIDEKIRMFPENLSYIEFSEIKIKNDGYAIRVASRPLYNNNLDSPDQETYSISTLH